MQLLVDAFAQPQAHQQPAGAGERPALDPAIEQMEDGLDYMQAADEAEVRGALVTTQEFSDASSSCGGGGRGDVVLTAGLLLLLPKLCCSLASGLLAPIVLLYSRTLLPLQLKAIMVSVL